jgi:hypothetical protein
LTVFDQVEMAAKNRARRSSRRIRTSAASRTLPAAGLAVLVLPTTSWPKLQAHIVDVVAAVRGLNPDEFFELTFQP